MNNCAVLDDPLNLTPEEEATHRGFLAPDYNPASLLCQKFNKV